jgi:hypothetical protein
MARMVFETPDDVRAAAGCDKPACEVDSLSRGLA